MKKQIVTRRKLVTEFKQQLRTGISRSTTAWYQTKTGSMTLFIEPDNNKMEVLAKGVSSVALYYDEDNTSWDSVTAEERTDNAERLHDELQSTYSKVKEEKGYHVEEIEQPEFDTIIYN